MTNKSLTLLLVAGGCGLVASYAVTKTLSAGNEPAPTEPTEAVVVMVEDQAAGTVLGEKMIKLAEWPKSNLVEGSFITDPKQVIGQALRFPVFAGDLLSPEKLGRNQSWLVGSLPQGMRACTVRVDDDEGNNAGLINPGDKVDVMWLYSDSSADTNDFKIQTLLQNIKVIAVGKILERKLDEEKDSGAKKRNEEHYTLLVSEKEYKTITLAGTMGKIRLALRGLNDNSMGEDSGVLDRNKLLPRKKAVQKKDQSYKVEIIDHNGHRTESTTPKH